MQAEDLSTGSDDRDTDSSRNSTQHQRKTLAEPILLRIFNSKQVSSNEGISTAFLARSSTVIISLIIMHFNQTKLGS